MLKDVLSVVYGLHKYKNQESEFETDHKSYKPVQIPNQAK